MKIYGIPKGIPFSRSLNVCERRQIHFQAMFDIMSKDYKVECLMADTKHKLMSLTYTIALWCPLSLAKWQKIQGIEAYVLISLSLENAWNTMTSYVRNSM